MHVRKRARNMHERASKDLRRAQNVYASKISYKQVILEFRLINIPIYLHFSNHLFNLCFI